VGRAEERLPVGCGDGPPSRLETRIKEFVGAVRRTPGGSGRNEGGAPFRGWSPGADAPGGGTAPPIPDIY